MLPDRLRAIAACVLVVDDHRDGADSLVAVLRLSGHQVEKAYDGEAALNIAETFRPEFVLLDVGMPKIDGLETCRRLRAQPWGREVFIVALTGLGQDEDRRRTEEAGFDHHMVKPIEPEALESLLSAR
jgi:CheY-like chemotaxis protein